MKNEILFFLKESFAFRGKNLDEIFSVEKTTVNYSRSPEEICFSLIRECPAKFNGSKVVDKSIGPPLRISCWT